MRSSDHEADSRWRGRLRDGVTPVQVDEDLLFLDREAGSLVRLDGDATRALASGDAAVSAALDSLGVTPTAEPGRREVLASGALAVLGITVMALPTAAVAVSPGPTGVTATGTTDIEFNPAVGAIDSIAVVVTLQVQSDGKILLGGVFSTVDGIPRVNIARLNSDGTLDTSFAPPEIAPGGTVTAIGLQSNGAVIVGAIANDYDTLLRLHPNGALDDSFVASIPIELSRRVSAILVLPDDRFLIGGSFHTVRIGDDDISRSNVARFDADGTLDADFSPSTDGIVLALAVDRDDRIILGGTFRRVNSGSINRSRLARIDANGTLDANFTPSASGEVLSLLVQPNSPGEPEAILVGGSFSSIDGIPGRLVRLNDSGSVVQTFGLNSTVDSLARQADGSIVVGGRFTAFDDEPLTGVARFSATGVIDEDFNIAINDWVRAVAVQPDGRILLGGAFTQVGGLQRIRVARLA